MSVMDGIALALIVIWILDAIEKHRNNKRKY